MMNPAGWADVSKPSALTLWKEGGDTAHIFLLCPYENQRKKKKKDTQ